MYVQHSGSAMKIKLLMMCLAAALMAVCHGCATGKEFITTFLPNYQRTAEKDHRLHVVLTAHGSEASVHIQVASVDFSRQLTLSAGESRWVSLPCGSELQQQFVTPNSAVRISSSAEISVVSFNRRHATGDGTVVSPTAELGTDYFVFTPSGSIKYMDRLLAIVNGNSYNQITILPGADVLLRGGSRWQRGKAVTVILAPYASYLVRSHKTLTGMRIQSQNPVAVLAGHQCLSLGLKCEHVYEQLPPLASLGKEYMVPTTSNCKAINWAVIVATEDNTEVTLHKGKLLNKQKLRMAGDVTLQKVIFKHPLVVESDKKVMVLLLSNNKPNDPFLITLTPTCKLATDWAVETVGGIPSTVAILSEREGAGSVKVCLKARCLSPKWINFLSDKRWVWSNVPVGKEQSHVTVEGDARMAVYVYGGKYRHAYGIAGICSEGHSTPAPPTDPCEQVKCQVKERCVNGACVHISTSTCRVIGDPHYLTFDGRRYDFQGSCTYIMATVAKTASDILPFTVMTKNDHRGNRRVSFVRTVTVSVHKQTIVIGGNRRQIQVNGELQYLPVSLLGGQVSVKQSGAYASLNTDFGLTVKYDWNMRLYITVPSSYYQHLRGLCGNYNGDRKDDLPEPKGSRFSAVLKMIQQWKVNDSDLFCHDNCAGRCPTCSLQQQAHFRQPKLCGILTMADGPFSACHKKVDPTLYLDNCVYDVCVNKGARQILCDNLKSYDDACLSEGVKVSPKWRKVSKCFLSCPAGSHYEACGSACPGSCVSPDSEAQCKTLCVEGCQCNKGLVLSGDRCVSKSNCGCQYLGRYYPSTTIFWGDNTCTTRCQCLNGKAECTSVTCMKNEHCALKGGVRDCYPESYASCQGTGDPHYRSFDNRRFDFQGTCTYILSQLIKGSEQSLVPFQVLVQNENRGSNKAVSFTKSVSISLFGNFTVSMSHTSPGQILVNTQSVNLPYSMEDGKLSLFRRGYFGIVTTYFGLTLRFNWNSHISLTLPSSYSGSTTGLCGNYNGKPADDLLKSDGTQAKHINAFGHSWKAGGDPGCTSDCPDGKCPECEPSLLLHYQQGHYCGIIADKSGPFRQCHSKQDHTPFLRDCVFDLCMYQGHSSALCNSLSAFSTSCQEVGATVESWRTEQFCPPSCGANSHYELCASPCQLTCSGLTPPEGCDASAFCTEGCVCDDGFMLSHDSCVPLAECGCQYEGQYYQNGQVFYPGESCNTRCVCSDGGKIQCDPKFHCSANEKCVVKQGFAYCSPRSVGSCSVSGVQTVRSFDGQEYPLWGNCVFKLSEVEENEGGMAAFSILLQQQTHKDDVLSRSVELLVYDMEITMETGVVWEIKVDDIRVPLPVSLADGKVRAHQNGINIIIETDFDLTLSYDTVAAVFLQIPSTYRNSPSGLCGNYNGELSDDLALASKKPADVAAVWVVKKDNTTCETSCGASSCPEPDGQKVPEAKKACDIIKAQQGPFAGCHATVPPQPDYDACVRELSTGKGGTEVLCRHIQNYVTACQLAGAKISKWRSDSFCAVTCPAGSHYELCATACSSTCYSLQRSEPCPVCQEGCQCNDGLMSDGVDCVPVANCGCVVDGQYYKSSKTVFLENCSERCLCQSGQFSCNSTNCQEGEECRNKDGTVGCYSTDPCSEVECRVKEHCEASEGQGVCIPDSKALCWAFGDPHYTTFDGWSYSFQGTCTYILVNTTGLDPSLPEVTVTTKNELRGNAEGSFVRSATVEMLGYHITIPSDDRGVVLVNGIKTVLPVFLEGGSISISESGIKGILQSDIGVEVTFDWSTLVMVSISSSYYGNVAGLCGNYNGNKEDEVTAAGGNIAVNVTEWVGTWSINDGDPFCYHYCEGLCPQCSEEDRIRFTGPEYCGILSDKKGPFSGCHSNLPVAEFVLDCLYDVCINEGRLEVLCEALSSYMTECQEAGVSVLPWRQLANCSVTCPSNSHYKVCGSACPSSCSPQPELCPKVCVEGCFCDTGYVQSGRECVVKETGCGCNHDGRYYLPGEVFWADTQCDKKCVCDAATQKVQCERTACRTGQICGVVDGVRGCYPISFKICTAHGDPHFYTFDERKFDFQGNCVYKLASVCGDSKGLTHFEVNLENNNRGNKRVSYAKVVTVKVYGNTYTLSLDYPGKVLVDGLEKSLPFSSNQSLVQVYRRHRLAVLETHFLKVSFDFASAVRVELASSYQNATCGLCGNFNDDPADDLMLPNGQLASNANEFGVSQWLANVKGCSHECKDCAQPLPPDFTPPSYTSVCDVITAKDGPLADCVGRVDSRQYHDDCIYDMVLNDDKQKAACDIISDYVEECQRKGGCVKSWRTRHFCWMQCAANSMYSITAPGCPISCSSLSPPVQCKTPPSEGCVCNPGFLLSQDRCVPLAECGCHFNGQYIVSGQKFYVDAECQSFCVCRGGVVTCKNKPCKRQQRCGVQKGVRACYAKRRFPFRHHGRKG
ncbi:IgGFc-binding protein isoform X2 [Dicentrarchus labrax]|uniref:IgGFc-binding protein isoform X2 n=1 Tax=Dicentrarchus labrax TaxID=13489 RepID=UPI0021F68437|nr:IgGFc-binding protein isoform X2 [Dicentrarchus labrax]XP_051263189.1 IgGFc-binding protein isoform X2 [Dicentrarchus labrax]